MKFIFAMVCLVAVLDEGLAKTCKIDDIKKCMKKFYGFGDFTANVIPRLLLQENICSILESQSKCLKDIPKICKEEFPIIPSMVSLAQFYRRAVCGENEKMFQDVIRNCSGIDDAIYMCPWEPYTIEQHMCESVDIMLCFAKFSKYFCKNGEAYGNALEQRMMIEKATCRPSMPVHLSSGAGYLANSFWTFATAVLSVLLIKNKLQ